MVYEIATSYIIVSINLVLHNISYRKIFTDHLVVSFIISIFLLFILHMMMSDAKLLEQK